MGKFEDNGGYFIDGVPYMDCKITGIPVKNVSTDATSVIGDKALMSRMHKMFPETLDKAMAQPRKKTGRPAGWHFMNEFVDKDGNVFHKGKEQPKLKGTLKPTKVKPPKKKKKRKTRDEILVAKHKEKLAAQRKQKRELAKELKKQKDFLNHKV
tara:strand:- start:425 stop:886 length:462 start_codon:yes stop_codon:yes gene_type:complete